MLKAFLITSVFVLTTLCQQAKGQQVKADCNLSPKNIERFLKDTPSSISKSCFENDQNVASIITQLTFEYENPAAAASFFSLSQLPEDKRSILPSKLISSFHKDVLVRRSQGSFKQPGSCEQVRQKLKLYQLVSEKLNLSRTTVWEDFHLIQAYYHQLLGHKSEAESVIDTIFEQIPISELPDLNLLSDIGYELTDYQLSFYLKFFDNRRNIERLSKDKSQQGLYEAVLKERAMYKQQLKAASKPVKTIQCK